ncbi:hypothetical protein RJ498_003164 [Pluralibacter gergoviae]
MQLHQQRRLFRSRWDVLDSFLYQIIRIFISGCQLPARLPKAASSGLPIPGSLLVPAGEGIGPAMNARARGIVRLFEFYLWVKASVLSHRFTMLSIAALPGRRHFPRAGQFTINRAARMFVCGAGCVQEAL